MTSPTQRSLKLLRNAGYCAAVVERRLPRCLITVDLFGCIDLVGIKAGEPGVLGVQATTIDHVSHRLNKAKGLSELRTWLAAGNGFEVWGWTKRGGKWTVKRVAVTGTDLQTETLFAPPRRPGGRGHRQRGLFDGVA